MLKTLELYAQTKKGLDTKDHSFIALFLSSWLKAEILQTLMEQEENQYLEEHSQIKILN